MYKVVYSYESINSLRGFIDSYKNSYIKLISDSGIDFEDFIIDNYILIGNKLYSDILDLIDNKFAQKLMLGRANSLCGEDYYILNIKSFRLFIYFKEDIKSKTRIIEKLEFFRK